jgi:hypothetical protein
MGVETVSLRAGTLAAAPVVLGSAEMRSLRGRFPAVRYTVASKEVHLRLTAEPPAERVGVHQGLEFLDAILEIRREIAA